FPDIRLARCMRRGARFAVLAPSDVPERLECGFRPHWVSVRPAAGPFLEEGLMSFRRTAGGLSDGRSGQTAVRRAFSERRRIPLPRSPCVTDGLRFPAPRKQVPSVPPTPPEGVVLWFRP